jgi:hypothetical protein
VEGHTIEDEQLREERRTAVAARGTIALQALGLGKELERFAEALSGLEPADGRAVYELVRWIAANWIGHHGPSHRNLTIEVAPTDTDLRALIFTDPELADQEFWSELVEGAPAELISSWAHDRRGSAGIWFELVRSAGPSRP